MRRFIEATAGLVVFLIPVVIRVETQPFSMMSRIARIAEMRKHLFRAVVSRRWPTHDRVIEVRALRREWMLFFLRHDSESEDQWPYLRFTLAREVIGITWFFVLWTGVLSLCGGAFLVMGLMDRPLEDRLRLLAFAGLIAATWLLDLHFPRSNMKEDWRAFGVRTERDMRSIGRCPRCLYKVMPAEIAQSTDEMVWSGNCPECGYETSSLSTVGLAES